MQRSEYRRSPGVKIPDSASGLLGATTLFEGVKHSPEETLSMDPTYPPNKIASQSILGTGLIEGTQMELPMSVMGTSGLPYMSLSSTPEVVAGVGAIPASMALGPPKKAVTKKKKGKKKKGKKKKGGYKKRRSTVRRSKKRRSTKRRSKKPTLKRKTQRKKK